MCLFCTDWPSGAAPKRDGFATGLRFIRISLAAPRCSVLHLLGCILHLLYGSLASIYSYASKNFSPENFRVSDSINLQPRPSNPAVWTALLLGFVTTVLPANGFSFIRTIIFAAFAYCAGVNVGTWIEYSLAISRMCGASFWDRLRGLPPCTIVHPLVKSAFLLSAGLYAGFTVAALFSKPGWRMRLGSIVSAGLWVLFGTYLLARLGWIDDLTFDLLYIRGGLVIYAMKVLVDTEIICDKARAGDWDVLGQAIGTLLNFLEVFIRVLEMLAVSKRDKRK